MHNNQTHIPQHHQPHQPQPDSTKKAVILLVVFLAIVGLVIWGIITLAGLRGGNDRDIVKNGVSTEGISSNQTYKGPQRIGRVMKTVYKAYYSYTVGDESYVVIGEKDYHSTDNIHAGMKATVYYLPDDPEKATVINEE